MMEHPLYLRYAIWSLFLLAGVVVCFYFGRVILSWFRKKPEELPKLGRLSAFSVLGFLSGLLSLAVLLAITILYLCRHFDILLQLDPRDVAAVAIAQTVLLYCTLVPVLLAVGFALAARGEIGESGGAVRGRAYYRAGVLMALLSGLVFLAA